MSWHKSPRLAILGTMYVAPIILTLIVIAILYVAIMLFPPDARLGLDKLLHLMGGFVAPLIVFALHRPSRPLLMIIGAAFIIGFWWECLEYFFPWFNGNALHSFTSPDTLGDLIFDTVGGMVAYLWYRFWRCMSLEA